MKTVWRKGDGLWLSLQHSWSCKKLPCLLVLAMLLTSVLTAADYSPPAAGLLGWWRGDGDASDASGHGHTGSLLDGATFGSGLYAQAFSLGDSYNRVFIPDSPEFMLTNSLTIGAWIYPTDDSWHVLERAGSTSGPITYSCGLDWNLGFLFTIKYSPANGAEVQLHAPISYNRWTQVTCTLDGSTGEMRIYMDGEVAAQTTTSYRPRANLNGEQLALAIGNTPFVGGFPFNGLIDEVVLYSRALSPAEVQSLANQVCTPHRATATAQVVNGFVVGATVTDGGCGYTNSPLVLIQGGDGAGATAFATVTNGVVTAITITSAGCCYTNTPKIVIASPPFVPRVSIAVSRVSVTQYVTLGRKYVLESSADLMNWTATGPAFVANSESITTEFVVAQTGQFFRLREVP